MASLEFDPEVNALYMRLKEGRITKSEPISDNIVIDLNDNDQIVGLEVLLPKIKGKTLESLKTLAKT